MKEKVIFTTVLCLSAMTPMMAQNITGKVMNTKGEPLAFANVVLLNRTDSAFVKGAVSGEDGSFSIDSFCNGGIIKVTSVGYKTICKDCMGENMGVITLEEDSKILGDVVVKAHRQQYKMKSDGILAQIEGTALEKMGSAEIVLRHLPKVVERNGSLEVMGKGTPHIYIDNRKVQSATELDRLSAEDIKHIEVITEPGSEYDATYNAVIKIKTKRKKTNGFSTNYRQTYIRNHQNSHCEILDMNYRYHGLDVFGTLDYSLFQGRQEQRNDNFVYANTILNVKENLLINDKSEYFCGKFGFNYAVNEKHSLGAAYEGNITPYGKGGWNSLMEVSKNGIQSEKIQNTYVSLFKKRPTHDINAYYAGQIGKVNINWDGEVYIRKNGQEQTSSEVAENTESNRIINTDYTSDSKLYATKLVLTIPIGSGTMKLGSEYTHSNRRSIYEIVSDENYSLHNSNDEIDESNLATFASYSMTLNKVELNGGLRYEHVVSDYYNQGKYVSEQSRKYGNLFPNLSLMFPVKNLKTSISYKMTINRPNYSQLSGNVQYNSRYYYQGGNPLLQPTYYHTVSLNMGYKWLQVFANWRYIKDQSYFCIEPYDEEKQISMYTYRNHNHSQNYNVGISASPKIGFWQPTLNANIFKQFVNIEGVSYNHPLFTGSLNNTFEFPHNWVLYVDMNYTSHGNSATAIEYVAQGGVDVTVNKSFFKNRLNITMACYDIFASNRSSSNLVYGNFANSIWKYTDTRKFIIQLTYKFNAMRSKYKGTGAGSTEKYRL